MTESFGSETSPSLIERARNMDRVAWERLSRLYTPLAYRWAIAAGLQPEDAADVVQEVFQAVARSITRFDSGPGRPPFRGWLYGITRNKIRDHFRNRLSQPVAEGGTRASLRMADLPEQEISDDSGPSLISDRDSLAFRALQMIQNDFRESTWRAFWEVTIENRAAADVAAELGISVGSVYTAKSRVLSHLRNELDGLS